MGKESEESHGKKGSGVVSWVAAFLPESLFINPGEIAVPRE